MTVASSGMGIQRSEVERVLESVGFGGEMRGAAISSLSGGWKMKLALGAGRRLVLTHADQTPSCRIGIVP